MGTLTNYYGRPVVRLDDGWLHHTHTKWCFHHDWILPSLGKILV